MPKKLSLSKAVKLAEKYHIAVFPVYVYNSRKSWNSTHEKHAQIWWCALPCEGSIFLPLKDYEKEWGDYITYFDTALLTSQLAETFTEAILKAAALAEKYEREWKEKTRRQHD